MDGGQDGVTDDPRREWQDHRAILADVDAKPVRERASGEWASRIFGCFWRRQHAIIRRAAPEHVGPVRRYHETGRRGGDGMVFGFLVGRRAHKGDRAGYAVTG